MNRIDGRNPEMLRPIHIQLGFLHRPEGSVYLEWGDTRLVISVSVEERIPPFLSGSDMGWLSSEYTLLAHFPGNRSNRGYDRSQSSGRSQEIRRFIGRSLRAALQLEFLGERTLWIDCVVLEADGGTRVAAVTGGWLALCLALDKLWKEKKLREFPVRHQVAAISLGWVRDQLLSDLNYFEDSQADLDANIVMTAEGDLVESQITAEHKVLPAKQLPTLFNRAWLNLCTLFQIQREILTAEKPDIARRLPCLKHPIPEFLTWNV